MVVNVACGGNRMISSRTKIPTLDSKPPALPQASISLDLIGLESFRLYNDLSQTF